MWRPAGAREGSSLHNRGGGEAPQIEEEEDCVRQVVPGTAGTWQPTLGSRLSNPCWSTPNLRHLQCRNGHKECATGFLHVLPPLQQYVMHIRVCVCVGAEGVDVVMVMVVAHSTVNQDNVPCSRYASCSIAAIPSASLPAPPTPPPEHPLSLTAVPLPHQVAVHLP